MATEMVARPRWPAERRFYTGLAIVVLVTVYAGFARSFFLRPLFPGFPSPAEPIFYVHGALFTTWCVLLLVQTSLVAARRTALHKTIGYGGVLLAAAMVALGLRAASVAATRPSGFIDVPVPPLEFLIVPFADLVLFAAYVGFAVATRLNAQAHKRWMVLATLNLLTAAIGRLPGLISTSPLIFFGLTDLFVVALAWWDIRSRRALHPVTLWGGLLLILSQPLRVILSTTPAWLAFARWIVGAAD